MFSLNNREIATLFWLALFGAYFLIKHPPVRNSLLNVIKQALHPKIVAAFAFIAAYLSVAIWGLYEIGAWTPSLLKATFLWFFFSGSAVAVNSIGDVAISSGTRKLIRDNVKVIIAVEFFVGAYVYPIWAELLIVPVVTIIAVLDAFAQQYDKYEQVAKITSGTMVFVGLLILAGAGFRAINEYRTVASLEALREVLLAPALAIAFIPCVGALVVYAAYDQLLTRTKIGQDLDPGVKLYALRRFLLACGINIKKVRALLQNHPGALMRISTKADVDSFVEDHC